MDALDKLGILAEAARYDAACTSSGAMRAPRQDRLGATRPAGCCHAFTPDGRCVTLLKVLLSNACAHDCAYCVNRSSASCARATFAPRELAELTVDFYKRNYVEGLFLSSGVLGTADATTERMVACLRILREDLRFNGYVHAKVIPGTSPELVDALGRLADRLSVNIELPERDLPRGALPREEPRRRAAPHGADPLEARGRGAAPARRRQRGGRAPAGGAGRAGRAQAAGRRRRPPAALRRGPGLGALAHHAPARPRGPPRARLCPGRPVHPAHRRRHARG